MPQTKHEIESILATAGLKPRHRFGQNFMIDQNLVRIVADAGAIGPGDCVIEVGPGTGSLTQEILSRGAHVVAVEIDRDLAKLLRGMFEAEKRFELIEGDVLKGKHELNPQLSAWLRLAAKRQQRAKLVANLPYNIASPLVVELLMAGVELLAFTVQKEVAMRMKALAGDDEYGPLSVMTQMLAEVEIVRTLPPQAFWPAPKVESALVRMERNDRLGKVAGEFSRFVHQLFSARRKTLRKALSQAGFDASELIDELKLDGNARPETISPDRLFDLFQLATRRSG
jgi:16S rRNA (adenine1518-N6/adenine1519-N6)-dimethyltransferase